MDGETYSDSDRDYDEAYRASLAAGNLRSLKASAGGTALAAMRDGVAYVAPQYSRIARDVTGLVVARRRKAVEVRLALLALLYGDGRDAAGQQERARVHILVDELRELQSQTGALCAYGFARNDNSGTIRSLRARADAIIAEELRPGHTNVSGMTGDAYLRALRELDEIAERYTREKYDTPEVIVYPLRRATIARDDEDAPAVSVQRPPSPASRRYDTVKCAYKRRYAARQKRRRRRQLAGR